MLERIATLEDELEIAAGMARYNDLRLKALEEGSGGVKLYKHNVYINSGNIGMYANEARIWLSYASPSASPITSLAELKNSPAATMAGTGVYAAWYLNYAYAVYDYEDAPDGPRDVRAVYIDSNEIRIFYITAYAVPSVYTTAIHKAHQVVITDTVTEV